MKYFNGRVSKDLNNTKNILNKVLKRRSSIKKPKNVDDFFQLLEENKAKRIEQRTIKYFNLPQFQDVLRLMGESSEDDNYTFRNTAQKDTCITDKDGIGFDLTTRGLFFLVWDYIRVNRADIFKGDIHIVGFLKTGDWIHIKATYESFPYDERVSMREALDLKNEHDTDPPFFKYMDLEVRKITNGADLFKAMNPNDKSLNVITSYILGKMESELDKHADKLEDRLNILNEISEDLVIDNEILT